MAGRLTEENAQQALQGFRRQQTERTAAQLELMETDPKAVLESYQLGRELGLPADIVLGQPEMFKSMAERNRTVTALDGAPQTQSWIGADPKNAALAKPEVDRLTAFERYLATEWANSDDPNKSGSQNTMRRILGRGALSAYAGIKDALPAMTKFAQAQQVGKTVEEFMQAQIDARGGQAVFDQLPAWQQATAMQQAQEAWQSAQMFAEEDVPGLLSAAANHWADVRQMMDSVEASGQTPTTQRFVQGPLARQNPDDWSGFFKAWYDDPVGGTAFVLETLGESAPGWMAAALVTSVTGSRSLGMATMSAGSYGREVTSTAVELFKEAGIDISTPEGAMAAMQDEELLGEILGRVNGRAVVVALLDGLSGYAAGAQMVKNPLGEVLAQTGTQATFGMLGEYLGQNMAGQDRNWMEIVLEGVVEMAGLPFDMVAAGREALFPGKGSGGGDLKPPSPGLTRDMFRAMSAGRSATLLTRIDEMAGQVQLREAAPEKFQELLEAQGLGDESVYVPAAGLRELFQSQGRPITDETLAELGIDRAEFEAAAASNNDIGISLAAYASKVSGTPVAAWVQENGTTNPDEMSVAEAKVFAKEMQERYRQDGKKAQDDDTRANIRDQRSQVIYDTVREQAEAAGVAPEVANTQASVVVAMRQGLMSAYGEEAWISNDYDKLFDIDLRRGSSQQTRTRGEIQQQEWDATTVNIQDLPEGWQNVEIEAELDGEVVAVRADEALQNTNDRIKDIMAVIRCMNG